MTDQAALTTAPLPATDARPPGATLSSSRLGALSFACCLAIATLYYSQPMLPLIGASFDVGPAVTSQIVTAGQFGYSLGLLLFVPLADRTDRRRLILLLLTANTVGMAACAGAPSLVWLIAAIFLAGAATVTPQIIVPTVAGLASPDSRGRAVGIVLSGMSAGLLIGRTFSGFLAEFAGWRTVFAAAVALNVPLALIIWRSVPATRPTTDLPYLALLRSLLTLLKQHPTLRAACMTGFLAFAAFGAMWATLASLLAQPPFQLGADVAGMFGLVGVVSICVAPALGRLADRLGPRVMITVGALILIAAFAAVSQTEGGLWLLAVGVLLIDIGYRSVLLGNQTRIYPLEPKAHSRLNTVFMTSVFFGGAFGSSCGAWAAAGSWLGVAAAGTAFSVLALLVHVATQARRA